MEVNQFGIVEFSEKKVVGKIKVEIALTEYDIDNIMVTALEGGIGYWSCLINEGEDWDRQPKDVATSQWATILLLEGKGIDFEVEDEGIHTLTLNKLIKGVELNHKNRPNDNDLDNGDSITSDCIIQYALFGDVVFG